MTIRLGLQGASGKTGGLVISVLPEFPQFSLGAAIVGSQCKGLGSIASGDVRFSDAASHAIDNTDCWIDFSTPASSVQLAELCAEHKKPLLIATTGFSDDQRAKIEKAASRTPILVAANTSLAVFALKELAVEAKRILGPKYDIEITEMHHNQKKDAPSGTALYLARELLGSSDSMTFDRSPHHEGRRSGEIGVTALRGGDVAGEHTIFFIGNGERIELTQRAWDRKVYARGALNLVEKLLNKPAGQYFLTKDLF